MEPTLESIRAISAFSFARKLLLAASLACAAPAMAACNLWQIVTFSDGAKGCLTDYRVSKAAGVTGNIGDSIPKEGGFVIAMPLKAAACPAVAGMFTADRREITGNVGVSNSRWHQDAIGRCEAAVRRAHGNPTECSCEAVVVDGSSPLTMRDFEKLSNGESVDSRMFATARDSAAPEMACKFWQIVTFSDGAKGCLTDYRVSKAAGVSGNVGDSVPKAGGFVVAMPLKAAACPAVAGMVTHTALSITAAYAPPVSVRAKDAVGRCEAAVRDAHGNPTECSCEAVVVDGSSPLTMGDFKKLSNGESVDSAMLATARGPATPELACKFWQVVTFSDGAKGCLTDYPVSKAAGVSGNVGDSVPKVGGFVVAMPFNTAACPAVAGMVTHPALSITAAYAPSFSVRVKDAVGRCEAAVRDAHGNPTECSCQAVVVDGSSPLSKSEFDALTRGTAAHQGIAKKPPSTSTGTTQAVAERQRIIQEPTAAAHTNVSLLNGTTSLSQPPTTQSVEGPSKTSHEPIAVAETNAAPSQPPSRLSQPATSSVGSSTGPTAAPDLSGRRTPSDVAELLVKLEALLKERDSSAALQVARSTAKVPHLTSRALVIGNSSYSSFPGLPNPGNDARSIAAKLRSYNIDVDLVVDADRDTLIKALNEYSTRAAGTDVNIFFYAGHGVQVDGVNYLVPTNMRADGTSGGYIKLAGIALNAALEYLPAKTKLVFLDACRDNPVSRGLVASRGGGAVGLAPVAAPGGTLIAYSTKDGATAEDGVGVNSPYTTALLQHLDAPDDISLVLRQVRRTVMRATSNRQEPWEYGSLVGDQLVLSQMSKP
jgi:hypothetical protein